jgi:REP element-mobilizing transposase RayT
MPVMRTPKQLRLSFDISRKRRNPSTRRDVPHTKRPVHHRRHPVHVTLRRRRFLPSMREQSCFRELRRTLRWTARSWFRVVHFSVQHDHVHLIVEADDRTSLSRGMTGLSVRLARAYNRALGRRGTVLIGRFHSRALRTPREMRNALVYVLFNIRKHDASWREKSVSSLDTCSSASWFSGWARPPPSHPPCEVEAPPVMPARTWIAREGWKRHGLLRPDECPGRRDRRHSG